MLTPSSFIFRLTKLRKVVTKSSLSSLLVVCGVDSKNNQASLFLINWLFLGYSGLEIYENNFLPSEFSELMMVLDSRGHLSLFLEPDLFEMLKGVLVGVQDLEVFVPNEEDWKNKDNLELIKIAQFIKMTNSYKKIGVLTKDNPIKVVEKWPIVQAYGQSELGFGFFTMQHEVLDIAEKVDNLYKNYDQTSLSKLYERVCKRLSLHIKNSFDLITDTKLLSRPDLTEQQLSEIIQESFEISQLAKKLPPIESDLPPPRILFGRNTDTSNATVSYSGKSIREENPFHCTVEYWDSGSKVRVGRTYFLGKNKRMEKEGEEIRDDMDDVVAVELKTKDRERYKDEEILTNLYLAMVIGFYDSLHGFALNYKNMTLDFIEKTVLKHLNRLDKVFYPSFRFDASHLSITLRAYNTMGDSVPINFSDSISFKLTPYIYLLRLSINPIPSSFPQNPSLGSLLYASCFILQEQSFLLLTPVPNLSLHMASLPEIQQSNFLSQLQGSSDSGSKSFVSVLGKQVQKEGGESLRVFFPMEKMETFGMGLPVMKASVIVFEKGIKINSPIFGCELILYSSLSSITVIQALQRPWLILQLSSPSLFLASLKLDCLAIEIPHVAYEHLLKIRLYGEEAGISVTSSSTIPSSFLSSASLRHEPNIFLFDAPPSPSPLQKTQVLDPSLLFTYLEAKQLTILNKLTDLKLSQFRTFFENKSSFINPPSSTNPLPPSTNPSPPSANPLPSSANPLPPSEKIQMIVILGPVGSGKRRMAESMMKFSAPDRKLWILDLSKDGQEGLLKKVVTFSVENKISEKDVILIIPPVVMGIAEFLGRVEGEKEFRNKFAVKTILVKLNLKNIYRDSHKNFVHRFGRDIWEGFCQFLLLDSFGVDEDVYYESEKWIKSVIKNTSIQNYRIINNVVTGGIWEDIINFNNFENELLKHCRIKNSIFVEGGRKEEVGERQDQESFIFVPWTLPIKKEKLKEFWKNVMKKEDGELRIKNEEISKKQEEEMKKVLKSKDQLAIELFKLKNIVSANSLSEASPVLHHIALICRFEEDLEGGLYEISLNFNYFKENKVKNVTTKVSETPLKLKKVEYEGIDLKKLGAWFFGKRLEKGKLKELLGTISIQKKKHLELRKLESLTEAEIKKINFDNRGRGLEDGEFYDGSCFRNNYGTILDHHPKLSEYKKEYMDGINESIVAENKKIDDENEETIKLYSLY